MVPKRLHSRPKQGKAVSQYRKEDLDPLLTKLIESDINWTRNKQKGLQEPPGLPCNIPPYLSIHNQQRQKQHLTTRATKKMKLLTPYYATLVLTTMALAEAKTANSNPNKKMRSHQRVDKIRAGKTMLTPPKVQHTFQSRIIGGSNASPGEYEYFGTSSDMILLSNIRWWWMHSYERCY